MFWSHVKEGKKNLSCSLIKHLCHVHIRYVTKNEDHLLFYIDLCEVLVHIFLFKGTQLSDRKNGELGPNLDNRLCLPWLELNTVLLSCECDRHLALNLQPQTQLHGRHLSFGLDWGEWGQGT